MTSDEILSKLSVPQTASDRLLDECRTYDAKIWEQHPELYLAFVERLIQQGHPGRALELAREGEKYLRDNSKLQYQLALAAARGGNPKYAETLLGPLLKKVLDPKATLPSNVTTKLHVDIIALQGRVLKDRSQREPALAVESAQWYERASQVPGASDLPDGGTFPLINAATMWRITGNVAKSEELAKVVVQRIEQRAEEAACQGNLWLAATLGEAFVLLGRHKEAIQWYLRAVSVATAKADAGDLASLRNNIRRLQQAGATASLEFLDEHLGRVVVFCGHMVDSPDRLAVGQTPRFPNHPNLIAAVKSEIHKQLDSLNAKVGYCSLACGGDILFAEAMLDRGAELHVVLPFAQHDFRRTSVDFGQDSREWRAWRQRFDDVLDRVEQASPDRIRYATREPYLGSIELFEFANHVLQGLAVLRARERASEPAALVLHDQSTANAPSFPATFAATWKNAGYECRVIDLGTLRTVKHALSPRAEQPAAPGVSSIVPRPVKAMLFADVAGYSGIKEWQLPEFLSSYGRYLHELFASSIGQKAVYANTWGDGLYVVFSDVASAADFAMELVEPTIGKQLQWAEFGLGSVNPFRVGLHSGPVFELGDIFQGRSCFAGQHVNRAARIEPVTLRGCAYASEPFAASLMISAGNHLNIETVGVHSLAKEYDRCALYRISR